MAEGAQGGGPPGHEVTEFPLGTLYAGVGYRYDPTGETQFRAATGSIAASLAQLNQASAQQTAATTRQQQAADKLARSMVNRLVSEGKFTQAIQLQNARIAAAAENEAKQNQLIAQRNRLIQQAEKQYQGLNKELQKKMNLERDERGNLVPKPPSARAGGGTRQEDPEIRADREARALIRAQRAQGQYGLAIETARKRMVAAGQDTVRYNRFLALSIELENQEGRAAERRAEAQSRAARRAAAERQRQNRLQAKEASRPTEFEDFAAIGLGRIKTGAVEVAAGFGLATGATEVFTRALEGLRDGFQIEADIAQSRRALGVFLQDMERGNEVVDEAILFGRQYGFTQEEIGKNIGSAGRLLRRSTADIEQVISVLLRLQSLSPEQGIEGAVIALNELTGGGPDAVTSLVRRFELPRQAAIKLRDEVRNGADAFVALDEVLNDLGANEELLSKRLEGPAGSINAFRIAIEDLKLAAVDLARSWNLDGLIRNTAEEFKLLASLMGGGQFNEDVNVSIIEGAENWNQYTKRLRETEDALTDFAWLTEMITDKMPEMSEATFNAAKRLIEMGLSTREVNEAFIENSENIDLAQGAINRLGQQYRDLQDDVAEIILINPDAFDEVQAAMERLFQTGDSDQFRRELIEIRDSQRHIVEETEKKEAATKAATQADKDASLALEALAKDQEELASAFQSANDDIDKAAKDMADALDDLARSHSDTVSELEGRLSDLPGQIQQQINDANAEAGRDRLRIEEDNAERISDFWENIRDRDAKDARQQRREDEKSQREHFQNLEEMDEEYKEARIKLVKEQTEARVKAEKEAADEIRMTDAELNAARTRSMENFVNRLFDLTRPRGGGGRKAREEANRRLEEARAEAAELAKIDAEAAQKLFEARQRQILDDMAAEQEKGQRLRDARRGDADFTEAEAIEEIDAETAARQEAIEAEVALIKEEAAQKKEQRDEDKKSEEERLQERIDDLDENYTEAVQKAKENFEREQQQRAEERAIEKQEREAEDQEAFADLERANARRLTEFDEAHGERIEQIRRQGEETRKEIEAALLKEDAEYLEAQEKIRDDYDQTMKDVQNTITEAANNMKFTPEEEAAQAQEELFRKLAERFGQAYVDTLKPYIDAAATPESIQSAPGAGTTTGAPAYGTSSPPRKTKDAPRGGRVNVADSALTGDAIDQVVMGGVQSSSYNDLRGDKLHQGVDLAVPDGTPIRSPVDGEVIAVGATSAGGEYIIVRDKNNGDEWYFGHLMAGTQLKKGSQVRRGQVIAKSDTSGSAITGPHVHVQLRKKSGQVVDPTAQLERLAGRADSGAATGRSSRSSSSSPSATSVMLGTGSGPGDDVRWGLPGPVVPSLANAFVDVMNGAVPGQEVPQSDTGEVNATAVVEFNNCTFGPGTDPAMFKAIASDAAKQSIMELKRILIDDAKHQAAQGNTRIG